MFGVIGQKKSKNQAFSNGILFIKMLIKTFKITIAHLAYNTYWNVTVGGVPARTSSHKNGRKGEISVQGYAP